MSDREMGQGMDDSITKSVSFSGVKKSNGGERARETSRQINRKLRRSLSDSDMILGLDDLRGKSVSFASVEQKHACDDEAFRSSRSARLHRIFLLRPRKTKPQDKTLTVELWDKVRFHLDELSSEGSAQAAIEAPEGDLELTFLHIVCMNDPPKDVVDRLLRLSPASVYVANRMGMLPLHVACRFGASVGVIESLLNAYPDAKLVRDEAGRVPLHYAVDPYSYFASLKTITPSDFSSRARRGFVANPDVVVQVLSFDLVTLKDNSNLSPLDLFSDSCRNIPPTKATVRAQAREILDLFLSCHPPGTTVFTAGLQSFPEWLLEDALRHPYVKEILNTKTAQPLFTTFVALDFGVQLLLTFSFTLVTRYLAEEGVLLTDDINGIKAARYAGISYLCFRALIKLTGFVKIRRVELWMSDAWNWVDITNIILLSASTALMQERPKDFQDYRGIVTITGGLQFIALISLLRTTSIPFSVFVTGALNILVNLLPFTVTTIILLCSFAFMYYTLNYDNVACVNVNADSQWNHGDVTFCSAEGSVMKVYSMFVGEINPEDFSWNHGSLWLSVAFAFLMVILQLNVLIAVITDCYSDVKRKGEEVFWYHRFYFLADLDTFRRLVSFGGFLYCTDRYEAISKAFRRFWDEALWELFGDSDMPSILDEDAKDKIRRGSWRGLLLLLIPLWLLGGVVTLGWLWPPQVRSVLTCVSPSLSLAWWGPSLAIPFLSRAFVSVVAVLIISESCLFCLSAFHPTMSKQREWLFCQKVVSKVKEPKNEEFEELKTKMDRMEQMLQKMMLAVGQDPEEVL